MPAETILPFPIHIGCITDIVSLHLSKEGTKCEVIEKLQEELLSGTFILLRWITPAWRGRRSTAFLVNLATGKNHFTGLDCAITNFETELSSPSLCQDLIDRNIATHGLLTAIASFGHPNHPCQHKPAD
ncbi:hypothetical protein O181_062865 [Austropuccinia psidii MF-1]|uniref:Uncharacterized protein n=1 Tax=Austropuccinia psidii MF-1 TaxID=1389203 RepID=A0A9Q3I1Q2_9BASI|nr:hypothetical protein [Austropuccinia psidii MF-1]